jgi:hypothetical protein
MQTVSQPFAASRSNPTAEATKQNSRSTLETGKIYTGKVLISREDGIDVQLDDLGVRIPDCIWASSVVGSLIGHATTFLPPVGTPVILLFGKPSFIIGSYSDEFPSEALANYKTITGSFKRTGFKTFSAQTKTIPKRTVPGDLLEGEIDITNAMACGLRLLTYISQLTGGDRAKVECHLLQDMVRIVCENFQHLSAFGKFEIFNNGRLNVKWDGTSYPHEAWNVPELNGQKLPVSQTKVQISSVDKYLDIGRWRLSAYMGFLGDFINLFISDPAEQAVKIGEDILRSGKCRFHAGNDGALLFQSTSEIGFERVTRIPVPIQLKRHQDPSSVIGEEFEQLNKEFLKIWDFGGKNGKTIHHAAFQLREYARWLSSYHSLSRFLQVDNADYAVPTEADTPAPSWSSKEKDKQSANAGRMEYMDAYATMRIMRDGSILHYCSYGHSFLMHKNGVHVSSSKDLTFEAANNIWLVAGQNIYAMARRNIEMSAIVGGIALKARTWLTALCEWGSIWLKSDAKDPNKAGYTAETPADAVQDPAPMVLDQAILLDAPQGRASILAARQIQLQTLDAPDDTQSRNDVSTGVVLASKQSNVSIFAAKDVNVRSTRGAFIVQVAQEALIRAKSWISEFSSKLIVFDKNFQYYKNALQVNTLQASIIKGINNIFGPKLGPVIEPNSGSGSIRTHYNHISKKQDSDKVEYAPADKLQITTEVKPEQEPPKVFPSKKENGPVWDFFTAQGEYAVPKAVENFETLTQQQLRQDNPAEYQVWDFNNQNGLKSGPKIRTGDKSPYPGKGALQYQHTGGDRLDIPSANSKKKKQTPLKKQKLSFRFLKR